MVINMNCAQLDGVEWANYVHVMIEARAVSKGAVSELYQLDIEEAILSPEHVEHYAVCGLGLDGAYTLLHEADTLPEAQTAVCEAFTQINAIHSIDVVAPLVLYYGFWDFEFDLDQYDDVESRGLSLEQEINGSHCYEETDQENADCFSVYGHLKDPNIGGCDCLATVHSVAEMAQLSKIIDALI